MRRQVLKASWPALLVACAALAPLYDKAFTVDDTCFLRIAEHALSDPFDPAGFSYAWFDEPEPMSKYFTSGPIGAYLLVPTVAAGGAEWIAHLTGLAVLAVALLASVSLALRLEFSPYEASLTGLLVVASPVVLAMSSTNMPDVPALALITLGVERLCAWRDERRWHQAVVAALALGFAPLARAHTLLIWPVAAVLVRRRAALLPLAASVVVLLAAMRLTAGSAERTGDVVTAVRRYVNWDGRNALALASYFAATLPLALPWIALRHRVMSRWSMAAGAVAAGLAWLQLIRLEQRHAWYVAPLAGLAAAVLIDVASDAWRRRDLVRGALLAWLLAALPIVAYFHMAAKYLVPSAPAAALLLVLAARESRARWRSGVLAFALLAGLTLGLLIARADAHFAGFARTAARELIAPRTRDGERVWFAGHWGFQWYAEQAGGRVLTRTPPFPRRGDVVVSATITDGAELVGVVARRRHIDSLVDDRPGGRVMSGGAGFYSNTWGYLPWAWSSNPIERYDVWRVE